MIVTKEIPDRFADYLTDWYYETYLLLGGYGSGKSYATAFKIVMKLLKERRKALVVREVYETIKDKASDKERYLKGRM